MNYSDIFSQLCYEGLVDFPGGVQASHAFLFGSISVHLYGMITQHKLEVHTAMCIKPLFLISV